MAEAVLGCCDSPEAKHPSRESQPCMLEALVEFTKCPGSLPSSGTQNLSSQGMSVFKKLPR